MSNYINEVVMSYKILQNIGDLNFRGKSVLIVGAGWMAGQYWEALKALGVDKVCVVSRSEESAKRCIEASGYDAFHGGYNKCLPELGIFDLVIIATPIAELKHATMVAMNFGNKNILVEKPGSLYSKILEDWGLEIDEDTFRVRIAYNRLTYPSLWKLKELIDADGGVTSCRYTFTEWIHTINFEKESEDCYKRWGISNSLHVISMAHYIIGMPKILNPIQIGYLPWHETGSRFVGAGISEKNIPFTYHADWESAGRWGVEIMTTHNAYRLIPLEKLYFCPKGTVNWQEVKLLAAFPSIKEGIAEEIAIMLNEDLEESIPLISPFDAARHTALAEKIFCYPSSLSPKQTI